ncbi:MAG: DNA polymerase III subunit alpha, partial [Tepidisphaeraceae bacterium]
RGETKGIFQFESGGMRDLVMKMQPDRLEDLIAANALYRPGPMELIPLYCNRKHGREKVPLVHPIMDEILSDTYGIMVYQEQVMRIFNQLGGIELSDAYKLIKAIGKKQTDVIAKFRPDFVKGARAKGIEKDQADDIFELILKFGGYGFNKSHSTRYAIVAFQTAYMKTYHPVEYMAALLTFEMGNTDKVVEYIEECHRMTIGEKQRGIRVLPPDINDSGKDFTPVYIEEPGGKRKAPVQTGVIRFGLVAVRGIGEKAAEAVIEQRNRRGEFLNIFDFCERVDGRQVTRSTTEALVKCGAFSSTGARRSQLLAVLDRAVEMGQQLQQDQRSGQLNIFGAAETPAANRAATDGLPDIPEIPSADLLKFEKDLLGFYVTSHPLAEHQAALTNYSTATTRDILKMPEGAEVTIGGIISRVKKTVAKKGRSEGKPMAIVTLEDLEGQVEATLFAETYAETLKKYPSAVDAEQIVFIKGKIDKRREAPGLLVNELLPIEEAISKLTSDVKVQIDVADSGSILADLKPVLARHRGRVKTFLQIPAQGIKKALIRLDEQWYLRPTRAMVDELQTALGARGRVELAGEGTRRLKRLQQQQLFQSAQVTDEPPEAQLPPEPMEQEV